MQEQPIVADERQEKITRLCLILAAVDGVIVLLTIVFPLLVMGEKAYTKQMMVLIWPPFIAMFITAIFFVYSINRIQNG